jgi:FkbM family methyltransferase
LLVEPIPHLAQQCRANRPRCLVENAALVSFDFPTAEVEMRYCGLMSMIHGAMPPEEEEKHIRLGCENQQIETYNMVAPAVTLSSLLDKHAIAKVDLLSLDVEGYELQVLKGIDFKRHRPEWMLIEARYRREIEDYLTPLYRVAAELTDRDILYQLRDSARLRNASVTGESLRAFLK